MTDEKLEDAIEALERIKQWANAYPTDIFQPVTPEYWQKANKALKEHDMSVDRLSADAMRHALVGVGRIAQAAIDEINAGYKAVEKGK